MSNTCTRARVHHHKYISTNSTVYDDESTTATPTELVFIDQHEQPSYIQIYHLDDENLATNDVGAARVDQIMNNDAVTQMVASTGHLDETTDSNECQEDVVESELEKVNYKKSAASRQQSSVVVPTLPNVEEIFKILSQKIAKYCQVLSDLTNCEVFYKAQLPLNNPTPTELQLLNSKKKYNYKPKNTRNKNVRSLYWGTNKMLHQFTHEEGVRYEKANSDSLIKINQRSLSNGINNLIEEILNDQSLNLHQNNSSDDEAIKTGNN